MNYNLTAEQDMIVRSLRAFREQELEPHEAEVDRTGEVPEELGRQIKQKALEMGFYAPNLPVEIGGGGLDYKTLALFERELGKTSYGLHGYIHRPSEILLACTGEQVEKYLMPCVSGEKKEVFALTESGAGSDIMSMTTNAKRDGEDFIINGSKNRNHPPSCYRHEFLLERGVFPYVAFFHRQPQFSDRVLNVITVTTAVAQVQNQRFLIGHRHRFCDR